MQSTAGKTPGPHLTNLLLIPITLPCYTAACYDRFNSHPSTQDNSLSNRLFSTLALHPSRLKNLASMGFESMTPIQAQSLPAILSGKDVIAQGQTGSGKTAAFGLGMLEQIDPLDFKVQSLVLCPTRELADQVADEIRRLARTTHSIKVLTLYGGVPLAGQADSLAHGAHIVVGTPGRIQDHLNRRTIDFSALRILVLDEADRMLEMGFLDSIDQIIKTLPTQRQTLLFSATYPSAIESIGKRIMSEPVLIKVATTHDQTSIEQHFYRVQDDEHRRIGLELLLLHHQPESALVFCNTKRDTQAVAETLARSGFSVLPLHGDLEQKDRDQTLIQFANKSISVLVATDVAARGLDIDELGAVFNFNMANDADTHLHRIGRTGRAGKKGLAFSFFSDAECQKTAMLNLSVDPDKECDVFPDRALLDHEPNKAAMLTLKISGGKKDRLRPGDILGALTGEGGIQGNQVGKIKIFDRWAYVAVNRKAAKTALNKLNQDSLKGRRFKITMIKN